MYGFTLRGPANKLADAVGSPSPSSSFCSRRGISSGRGSNLIGAILSALLLAAAAAGAAAGAAAAGAGFGFATAGFGACALGAGLGTGLLGFTVTFDVAMGFAFAGGRAAFLGAAAL
jgi:hypothetical protein